MVTTSALAERMSKLGWLPSSSVWELARKRCDPAAAPPKAALSPNLLNAAMHSEVCSFGYNQERVKVKVDYLQDYHLLGFLLVSAIIETNPVAKVLTAMDRPRSSAELGYADAVTVKSDQCSQNGIHCFEF